MLQWEIINQLNMLLLWLLACIKVNANMATMSCTSSSGEQIQPKETFDRISLLPWNVQDIILQKLPIMEVVRMSVLAKDWRYKWLSLSEFICNDDLRPELLSTIVNKFMLHHTSSIKKFSLSPNCAHYPEFYLWIQYLTTQNVEELSLTFETSSRFEMPSRFFMLEKLKNLFLRYCSLHIPSLFGRFNSLIELSFFDVSINAEDFERLIIACPRLLKLTLKKMLGLVHLRIRSRSLLELTVDSEFEDIVIGAGSYLKIVCIDTTLDFDHREKLILNWRSVIRSFSGLTSLQVLSVSNELIQLLAANGALSNFPLRIDSLVSLALMSITFDSIEVFRVFLSLLSSCPNLKNLKFTINSAKGPKLIEEFLDEVEGQFSFTELESLRVICPSTTGMGCTVNFIEFLAAHSPNLMYLNIDSGGKGEMNTDRVSSMLSRIRRICPDGLVQYTYKGRQSNL